MVNLNITKWSEYNQTVFSIVFYAVIVALALFLVANTTRGGYVTGIVLIANSALYLYIGYYSKTIKDALTLGLFAGALLWLTTSGGWATLTEMLITCLGYISHAILFIYFGTIAVNFNKKKAEKTKHLYKT